MAERSVYFAAEIADMLGMSVDTLYQQRAALHARGMPQPVTLGRLRINKRLFDAWLARPQPVMAAANDSAPAGSERELLHRAYGRAWATP